MSGLDGRKGGPRIVSLWDMIEAKVGRLLELCEAFTIEKGAFENGHKAIVAGKASHIVYSASDAKKLRSKVAEVSEIVSDLGLQATAIAAKRTLTSMDLSGYQDGATIHLEAAHCAKLYDVLLEILSRLRDDCNARVFYQIHPSNALLLHVDFDHLGSDVSRAFPQACEDISEAAACLALERFTACVFHLMRALEVAVTVVAAKIGATIVDEHGKGLAWGVIASNMKPLIDKMQKGSDAQIAWYKVHAMLDSVGRAWRNPTAHPKQTYSEEEARRVFEATRGFMQALAPLA